MDDQHALDKPQTSRVNVSISMYLAQGLGIKLLNSVEILPLQLLREG